MNLTDLRNMALVEKTVSLISAKKKSILGSVIIIVGGTALSQILVVISSPILTRLYDPASFGIFTLYLSITQILLAVISWRYELAISLPKDDMDGAHILLFAIILVVFNALLLGIFIYLWGDNFLTRFNLVGLKPYLWVLPLALLGAGFYQALGYWAIRRKAYPTIAHTTFSKSVATVVVQIATGLLGWRPLGLLFGDFVGRFVGSGRLGKLAVKDNKDRIGKATFLETYQQAYRYRNFALLSTPATLIDRLALYLPAVILAYLFTPQVVGWFGLGQQVIGVPITFIGQAVSQVYLGEASVFLRESPEKLKKLYAKFSRGLFLFGLIPISVLAIFGSSLATWFFGSKWASAGMYIQILAPMYLIQIAISPLSQTLNILERQSWQFAWEVGQLLLELVCMYYAWHLSWGPTGVIIAFSLASFITYAILYLVTLSALSHVQAHEQ